MGLSRWIRGPAMADRSGSRRAVQACPRCPSSAAARCLLLLSCRAEGQARRFAATLDYLSICSESAWWCGLREAAAGDRVRSERDGAPAGAGCGSERCRDAGTTVRPGPVPLGQRSLMVEPQSRGSRRHRATGHRASGRRRPATRRQGVHGGGFPGRPAFADRPEVHGACRGRVTARACRSRAGPRDAGQGPPPSGGR
jgi:hypothetical protein